MGRYPDPRVDEEEHGVRGGNCGLRLPEHAAGEALRDGLFEARRIDDGKREIAKPCFAFASIPRHSRHMVDEGQSPADQAVEERRFADVGASDNGKREAHGAPRLDDLALTPSRKAAPAHCAGWEGNCGGAGQTG